MMGLGAAASFPFTELSSALCFRRKGRKKRERTVVVGVSFEF